MEIQLHHITALRVLAVVAIAMMARGAFADKVVALPSLPEAGLPNSEVTTNIAWSRKLRGGVLAGRNEQVL